MYKLYLSNVLVKTYDCGARRLVQAKHVVVLGALESMAYDLLIKTSLHSTSESNRSNIFLWGLFNSTPRPKQNQSYLKCKFH